MCSVFKKSLFYFFHYHLAPLYPPPTSHHHTVEASVMLSRDQNNEMMDLKHIVFQVLLIHKKTTLQFNLHSLLKYLVYAFWEFEIYKENKDIILEL